MSRRRSDDVRKLVQHEVQRQLGALGLATKADLAALERRLERASRPAAPTKAAAAPGDPPRRRRPRRPRRRHEERREEAPAKKATAKKAAPDAGRKAG